MFVYVQAFVLYIHSFIHTFLHSYVRMHLHTYIRTYIHTYIHLCTLELWMCFMQERTLHLSDKMQGPESVWVWTKTIKLVLLRFRSSGSIGASGFIGL